jgi:hypothetical protein
VTPAERWKALPRWVRLLLTAADKWVNWRLGGDPDELLSARLARARNEGDAVGGMACALLDRYDPGHCDRALRNPHGERP